MFTRVKKGLCCLSAAVIVMTAGGGTVIAANGDSKELPAADAATDSATVQLSDIPEYAEYAALYENEARPDTVIDLTVAQLPSTVSTSEDGTVLNVAEDNTALTFSFTVEQAGVYYLAMTYQQHDTGVSAIMTDVLLDGKLPHHAASGVMFARYWEIAEKKFDSRGNEISTEIQQVPLWVTRDFNDAAGRYNTPLAFYLSAGEHTLTVQFLQAGLLLKQLQFYNPDALPSYQKPNAEPASGSDTVEGEDYLWTSDSTILLGNDSNDAAMSPIHPELRYYNLVGGNSFATPQQQIAWEVEVPESGYYKLAFKVRQNIKSGSFSNRCLRIDGEIPYAECQDLRFPYNHKWYNMIPSDAHGDAMLFYLEAGKHEISLEVVPGEMADSMIVLQDSVDGLNRILRDVITVVGTDEADRYRDYYLSEDLPELAGEIAHWHDVLKEQYDFIAAASGEKGSDLAVLQTMITQLDIFSNDVDNLALKMTSFKANISALAAWVNELTTQPLEIDVVTVYGDDSDLPLTSVGFFEKIWFTIQRMFATFKSNYGIVGDTNSDKEELTVWIFSGQEQLSIIQALAEKFSNSQDKVNIRVELVAASLLEAIMAGEGPDIALGTSCDFPVNMAVRGELTDLTQFEGFDQVKERYREQTLRPYWYQNGCYALPLTDSFPMLFVRTDIFEEYGLQVPQTWDELYEIAAIFDRDNLDVGIPSDMSTFSTLFVQNGGTYYNKDLTGTDLSSDAAVRAFREWTTIFSERGFDLSYNFLNRFRTGEMPIGISPYSMYSQLMVSAPEISGRWEMYPMVGIRQENGEINNACSNIVGGSYGLSQGSSSAVILKACANKQAAWDFLSWYTSDEVQLEYGEKIEMRMGVAARFEPANYRVLGELPWTEEETAKLYAQWDKLETVNEVPGSYHVGRNVTYAFRQVVYNDENPVYMLNRYNDIINREMTRKLEELQG
ncbi:MAG: extracellular solute-binding protein [Clostridia bacterium]|nr:extracellular solute-binding protein [Clostridia bacterium]